MHIFKLKYIAPVVTCIFLFSCSSTKSSSRNDVAIAPKVDLERRPGEDKQSYEQRIESRKAYRAGIIEAQKNMKSASAKAAFQKAHEIDQSFAWPLYNQGVLAEHAGDFNTASRLYKQAIEVDPQVEAAVHNLGLLLKKSGREREAETLYRSVLSAHPENAAARVGLASLKYESGNEKEALILAKEALQYDGTSVGAYRLLALIHAEKGDSALARLFSQRGQKLQQGDPDFLYADAIIALQEGRTTEGRLLLKNVVKRAPNHSKARMRLLQEAYEVKDWAGIEAQLRELLVKDANNWVALNNLGIALKGQGRFEEAKESYIMASSLQSNSSEAQWNLGVLYIRDLNDPTAGRDAIRSYLRLVPRAGKDADLLLQEAEQMIEAKRVQEKMLQQMAAEQAKREAEQAKIDAEAAQRGSQKSESEQSVKNEEITQVPPAASEQTKVTPKARVNKTVTKKKTTEKITVEEEFID